MYIHAGHKARNGCALPVYSLVAEAHSGDLVAVPFGILFEERFTDRHRRPDLHQPRRHDLRAHPLVELADRHHQPAALVQELRRPWQMKGMIPNTKRRTQ